MSPVPSMPAPIVLADGRFARFVRRGQWEYVERHQCRGAVVIVAVTAGGRLLLTEQFRVPVAAPVIELPAGLVGDQDHARDESVEEAARRELLEETGYEASRIVPLVEGPPSAGLSSEQVWMVRAEGLVKRTAGGGDGSEAITVHDVPLAGASAWLAAQRASGRLVDVKVYAGLLFAASGR